MVKKVIKKKYKPLRVVKVIYSDGTKITTSMSAGLKAKEIRSYFKVGQIRNIGDGERDKLVRIKKVVILK